MTGPAVYVLGAGMSVESGIPAMNKLTNLMLSETYMLGQANALGNFCGFAFPNLEIDMDMDGAVIAEPGFVLNIEQFMSALDAYRSFSDLTGTWKGLVVSPERVVPLFMHLVGRAIIDLSPDEIPQYYRNFASSLRPGDSVITLNWDCLLERACDATRVRWTYPQLDVRNGQQNAIIDDRSVTIIKLHGSVDWRQVRDGLEVQQVLHSVDGQPVVVRTDTPLREEDVSLTIAGGRGGLELTGAPFGAGTANVHVAETPFIIPPSHFKEFPEHGLPGLLWTVASRALCNAERVTIVGYSLPITDYIPRWLLRFGLLFNRFTGPRLAKQYLGYRLDDDDPFVSGLITEANINELRMQVILAGVQSIRRCWDVACIPIEVINPDAAAEAHFKRMVTMNVNFHEVTAGQFYG